MVNTMEKSIDINCDLGESFGAYTMGDDAAMLEIVTSANVACGFHAGDPMVMHETLKMAKARNVRVGAHPGFFDLWGFGRRPIQGERPEDIEKQLIYQIGAIQAMAHAVDWPITHFKAHGSLANMAAVDEGLAKALIASVKAVDQKLIMVATPFSVLATAAQAAGLNVVYEVFADRTYDDTGQLTSRKLENAVIHDFNQSVDHVLRMVTGGEILTTSGNVCQ